MKHHGFFLVPILFALSLLSQAAPPKPVVQTQFGLLSGNVFGDTEVFKGIPYASPPTGTLRWQAPQDPAVWTGILPADEFGSMCPQPDLLTKNVVGDEDCLKLNIWRPLVQSHPLPVLFFIHGGGNTIGAGNQVIGGTNLYDGTALARGGAIVVTMNYRLGALGFLAHPSLRRPSDGLEGNYAILDQLQALKFVRNNIAAFGGDPANVTVFGESAGGINVLVLLASPLSRGLFAHAIVESGFLTDVSSAVAEAQGNTFVAAVGCDKGDTAQCLRSTPFDTLVKAYSNIASGSLSTAGATVDGVLLREGVLSAVQAGRYERVPVLIGTNQDEFRTLAPALLDVNRILSDGDVLKVLQQTFGDVKAAKIQAYYPTLVHGTPLLALEAALTDSFSHCKARTLARSFVQFNPSSYRYVFTHSSQNPTLAGLGAGHGLELPYVFGTLDPKVFTPVEFGLSTQMMAYWEAFAKTGHPNVEGLADWPSALGDVDMNLDLVPHAEAQFRAAACDFWDHLEADPQ